MRIVIVGNSATAVGAVETIRQHDQASTITIVSEEPHGIYSRPMLDHYLGGEIDAARLNYRPSDFYVTHNVQPLLADRVSSINPEAHTVNTESGQVLSYDKLLLATGGQPIVPPMNGLDTGGVFSFTRLDDARAIEQAFSERSVQNAIVVGGGMIGMKVTDALCHRGLKVTLAELAPRILSAAMDEIGASIMTEVLLNGGVEVLTGNTVSEIHSEDGWISSVTMKDGSEKACDLLVFGIGVRPNAGLARDAGIEVNRGIVVDRYMCTSAPDVYAAGDVAEAYDLVVDMNRTVAIWPNAYRQGAIAGAHMVGIEEPDQGGVAMNAVQAFGIPAMAIGNGNVEQEGYSILADENKRNHRYKKLVFDEKNHLVGAILVGDINRAGIYTGLIRAKLDLSECKDSLLSDHFGLLSLPGSYRKHVVRGLGIEV